MTTYPFENLKKPGDYFYLPDINAKLPSLRVASCNWARRVKVKVTVRKTLDGGARVELVSGTPQPFASRRNDVSVMAPKETIIVPWRYDAAGNRISEEGCTLRAVEREAKKTGKKFFTSSNHKGIIVYRVH